MKGLALMQWEERHSATKQVKVEDNKHQVGSSSQGQLVNIRDWIAPVSCSGCVAMKFNLQGIHEDCGSMCTSSNMGKRSVHLEAVSEINASKLAILDKCLGVIFLTTRVKAPDTDNWKKLSHIVEYLKGKQD